jgi:hypothetical protein
MASGFLQDVAAPYMSDAGQDLLQLWEQKARLAKGRAFDASEGVHCTTMNAVWPIVLGADPVNDNSKAQLRLYATIKEVELPNSLEEEAVLPRPPYPEMVQSFLNIMHSVEVCIKSPMPILSHWLSRQTTALKKSIKDKNRLISQEIDKAVERAMSKSHTNKEVMCALDNICSTPTVNRPHPHTQNTTFSENAYF